MGSEMCIRDRYVGRTRTDSDHQGGMVHRAWSNGAVALVLVLRGLIRVLAPDSWEPGAWRAPSPQTFVCRGLIRVLAADSWKPGAWRAPREGGFRKKRKKERRREGERSRAEKKKEAHETPERKGEGRTKGRRRRSQGIEGAREYRLGAVPVGPTCGGRAKMGPLHNHRRDLGT